jgi:hypothetical protein
MNLKVRKFEKDPAPDDMAPVFAWDLAGESELNGYRAQSRLRQSPVGRTPRVYLRRTSALPFSIRVLSGDLAPATTLCGVGPKPGPLPVDAIERNIGVE